MIEMDSSLIKANNMFAILTNLIHAIQYTSTGEERQYVNRKHITNIINQLRRVLLNANLTPKNQKGESRINDLYWYINIFQVLAGSVRGKDGIKHLIKTMLIIESLLKEMPALQYANVPTLEQAVLQYTESIDNEAILSVEEDKELIESFLYGNDVSILKHRGRILTSIRRYLESYLHSEGHKFNTLYDSCASYASKNPKYKAILNHIRTSGNQSIHSDWRDLDEAIKQLHIKLVKNSVDKFPEFKQFLISEMVVLANTIDAN